MLSKLEDLEWILGRHEQRLCYGPLEDDDELDERISPELLALERLGAVRILLLEPGGGDDDVRGILHVELRPLGWALLGLLRKGRE